MTRRFDGLVFCPYCRRSHTAESAFERWMREQETLDSRLGLVRFDLDVLIHRYMTANDKRGTRDLQLLMAVEVKTRGGALRASQQDTLSMLAQVLRNRKTNMHQKKKGMHATDHSAPCKVYSRLLNREVRLKMFGMHLLTLSGDDPTDSQVILWDGKRIDLDQLVGLLGFKFDPDTLLRETDWRRRYSAFDEPTFDWPAIAGREMFLAK